MVENKAEPSSKPVNEVRTGLGVHKTDTNKGASSRHPGGNVDVEGELHRQKTSRITTTAADELENLSDIDDVQVTGYLLNKEEMHYKRIIWEAMNREYPKRGTQKKRAAEAKICTPAKRAAKTTSRIKNEKSLSSRINYDALKKLNDELNGSPENSKRENAESDYGDDGESKSNDKPTTEVAEPGNSDYSDELEQETDYREDGDTFGEYDGNMNYGDEEDGYGYGYDEYGDYED